ncbi:GNAT family N-acetyltransferase [Phaeobacter inhibens]|uniref:GNAT family N-acetyltransferase n=1 Tax=Phaeobacter inhibens TaxID=221822 RepID=UPI00076BBA12|nr:GNAT family N-acetyltransferase [Phaeobacter inhibens]KXF92076.1 ABC transporter ATP-binding protein [Phaeobacter inhibens]WHP69909.1 GNAT family N-acetyltransferase [Phaeobacter inhibens]
MKIEIHHRSPIPETYRAARVSSMFNVEGDADFRLTVRADLDARPWQVGLIVGPSGSGKTSLGRALFGRRFGKEQSWPKDDALIDAIAPEAEMDGVTAALSAVGLGSVPSWLRPYRHLSNGEQFRAGLARLLCERPPLAVVDEFTSTIDRRVARIGAAAFAKAWRRGPGQFVGVTCHDDVVDWLQPDWVIDTRSAEFKWRRLRRAPRLTMDIHKTDGSYWPLFEPHHYLKANRPIAADYYVGFAEGEPIAHACFSPRPGLCEAKACRLVVMPQWQGAGVGVRFLTELAALWRRGLNRYERAMPTLINTSHPGLAASLRNHPLWHQVSCSLYGGKAKLDAGRIITRMAGHMRALQGFRYVEELEM